MFARMKSNAPKKQQAPIRTARPASNNPGYSAGVRKMNKNGFESYNIDESEIYISKVPESVLFNDGEAKAVKAQPGVIVGLYRPEKTVEVKKTEPQKTVSVDEMFSGVKRGSESNITAYVGTYKNGVMKKTQKITDF